MKTKAIVWSLLVIGMTSIYACGSSKGTDTATEETAIVDESAPVTKEEGTDAVEESTSETPAIDQRDPERVLEGIFAAAESGNYTGLDGICASDADGDCKSICSIATADAKKKEEFKSYFSSGVVTNTEITGDHAHVDFKFGPNGEKEESMKLVLVSGKWYIQSF